MEEEERWRRVEVEVETWWRPGGGLVEVVVGVIDLRSDSARRSGFPMHFAYYEVFPC